MTFAELEARVALGGGEADIVDGILPPGMAILVGGPKTGKTRFVIDLLAAVATGGLFLGRYQALRGRAIYYMFEPSPAEVVATMNLFDIPGTVDVDFEAPADGWTYEAFEEDLRRRVAEQPNVRLAVVDMVDRVQAPVPPGGGVRPNENGYEQARNTYSRYHSLAKRLNIALVLLLHCGTNSTKPIGGNGVLGSADTVWTLEREPRATRGTLTISGRNVKDDVLGLSWDPKIGRWSATGASGGTFVVDVSTSLLKKDVIARVADDMIQETYIEKPRLIEAVGAALRDLGQTVAPSYLERELDRHFSTRIGEGKLHRRPSKPVAYRRAAW